MNIIQEIKTAITEVDDKSSFLGGGVTGAALGAAAAAGKGYMDKKKLKEIIRKQNIYNRGLRAGAGNTRVVVKGKG